MRGIALAGMMLLLSCDEISAAVKALGEKNAQPDASVAPPPPAPAPAPPPAPVTTVYETPETPLMPPSDDPILEGVGAPDDEADDKPLAFSSGDPSYREDDCTKTDVSAIASAYQPGHTRAAADSIARLRYPTGAAFIKAQDDTMLKAWFSRAPDTFDGIATRFEVAIHEGSHVWRSKKFNGRTEQFPVRGDLVIEARRFTTFHRNEILTVHVARTQDPYAQVYLEGQSGAQGFATLLDEYQAYTHSLASRYCIRDLLPQNQRSSTRDGILTMMYYVETYLALAREKHPETYAAIVADAGYRKVILTVWDRAEFWLRKSRDEHRLGISDHKIAGWVYEPSRLAEIAKIRERETAAPKRADGGRGN